MIDEKKKMTAQDSSVGADDRQSISKNSDISITTYKLNNFFYFIIN